jgi:hypothetical protein
LAGPGIQNLEVSGSYSDFSWLLLHSVFSLKKIFDDKGPNNSHKLMKLWLRFGAYCPLFRPKFFVPRLSVVNVKFDNRTKNFGLKRGQYAPKRSHNFISLCELFRPLAIHQFPNSTYQGHIRDILR